MSPLRTMYHIKKLIDGDTSLKEKTKIVKWHFPDWEEEDVVDEDFFENLTDGMMLDMIYDMATNSLKQEEAI